MPAYTVVTTTTKVTPPPPSTQAWSWPASGVNADYANLISGLVFDICMTSLSDCVNWIEKDACTNPSRYGIWARLPRSIFMGIDTVYMDNPAEAKQLYKPYDASAITCTPNNFQGFLAPNSTIEIKFDPGYYLTGYTTYKDGLGATLGIALQAKAINSWGNDTMTYLLGEAFKYGGLNYQQGDAIETRYPLLQSTNTASGDPAAIWVYGFQGHLSGRDKLDGGGGYFDMDQYGTTEWYPALDLVYNGSANYNCCFMIDFQGCSDAIIEDSLCLDATNNFCSNNKNDYMCRKYLAAQANDSNGNTHTATDMLFGVNPPSSGTWVPPTTIITTGTTSPTGVQTVTSVTTKSGFTPAPVSAPVSDLAMEGFQGGGNWEGMMPILLLILVVIVAMMLSYSTSHWNGLETTSY